MVAWAACLLASAFRQPAVDRLRPSSASSRTSWVFQWHLSWGAAAGVEEVFEVQETGTKAWSQLEEAAKNEMVVMRVVKWT